MYYIGDNVYPSMNRNESQPVKEDKLKPKDSTTTPRKRRLPSAKQIAPQLPWTLDPPDMLQAAARLLCDKPNTKL